MMQCNILLDMLNNFCCKVKVNVNVTCGLATDKACSICCTNCCCPGSEIPDKGVVFSVGPGGGTVVEGGLAVPPKPPKAVELGGSRDRNKMTNFIKQTHL